MLGEDSPFISELADKGQSGVLQPPLSYCLHPTWFAGLNPESSDSFFKNVYSPQTSSYQRLRLISFLKAKEIFKLLKFFPNHYLPPSPYGGAPHIPNHLLQYFDSAEKTPPWDPGYLPQVTLFDVFREHGINWLFIGSPDSDQRTFSIMNNIQKTNPKKHSFIWLHFAELDWICHKYGPESLKRRKKLYEIDNAIKKIYKYLNNLYADIDILIFGDHGHVEVNRTFDIASLLKNTSSQIIRDYIYFLDSTVARFWFRNEKAKNEISSILADVNCGKYLQIKASGTKHHNSKHGELIWVVNEGYVILPNFWQGNKRVKGMHGYCSDVQNNDSCFVLSGSQVPSAGDMNIKHKLVDLFPTLLDLMHLPIPTTNEGTSILSN
jgi:hypothetical protein